MIKANSPSTRLSFRSSAFAQLHAARAARDIFAHGGRLGRGQVWLAEGVVLVNAKHGRVDFPTLPGMSLLGAKSGQLCISDFEENHTNQ